MSGLSKIFRSLFLLLAYTASLIGTADLHTDLRSVLGGGVQQIGIHSDVGNCKHINVSDHEHCILCSVNSGKVSILSTPASIESSIAFTTLCVGTTASLPYPTTNFPFSRRGPPSVRFSA
jgi:hypothetical protein